MNRASRRDRNEAEIVTALERLGCSVTRLSATGVPDLLVGFSGHTHLLEVKAPPGSRGRKRFDLTPDQQSWWGEWKGARAHIVRSVADALAAVGIHPAPLAGQEG